MAKYSSTGMEGFSEQGPPADWDFGVGEVYGYRWWKMRIPPELAGYEETLGIENLDLSTPLEGANRQLWTAGKQEAKCVPYIRPWMPFHDRTFNHEPPEYREECGCGFWAYFSPELNASNVIATVRGAPSHQGTFAYIPVFGVIKGYGRVIIGDKGFRSQFAEIIGLCVSDRAVENLSHDVVHTGGLRTHTDNYGRLFAVLRGEAETRDAAARVVAWRVSVVEGLLAEAYPEARIFTSQNTLRKYFPPDTNYG